MERAIVVMAILGIVGAGTAAGAEESRPAPLPGVLAQAGPPAGGPHHGPPSGGQHGMMGHGGMGGMMGGGGMGGTMGRGMARHGREHLEHLMVHEPRAAARIMRFRADMMRAMSEVLLKHAAELEKAQ
jgi:hypothetical protein